MTTNGAVKDPIFQQTYKPGPNSREKFSLCIYGKGGTGKTTLIGTMPGKGLIIDTQQHEGGTFVLEREAERIEIFPLLDWDTIEGLYWGLQKGGHNYDWVAIDSITGLTKMAIKKVVRDRGLDVDPAMISQQDWGKVGQLLSEVIGRFRTLSIHVLWIAQERTYGSDNEPKVLGPDTSPAARSALIPPLLMCGRLSVVYNMDGTIERHLRIGSHPDYDTKSRARAGLDVPAIVRNPSLAVILKYLLGSGQRPDEYKPQLITSF